MMSVRKVKNMRGRSRRSLKWAAPGRTPSTAPRDRFYLPGNRHGDASHRPVWLQRFIDAQSTVYASVTEELPQGRKQSHWMWFVFPQLVGLGFSAMTQRFAIGSKGEARLTSRMMSWGRASLSVPVWCWQRAKRPINAILGSPDDIKFRSSMTLFDAISKCEIFAEAIGTFYPEGRDPATLDLLRRLGN